MPGAMDGLALKEAFGERAVVMAAMRVDGEDIRPRAHQQHVLVADMAEQHRAREVGEGNALCQIRTGRSLLIGHIIPPSPCDALNRYAEEFLAG
ncbi:hypothetical protein ACVJF2_001558 [Bradyrhizobium sp. USDA 4519]